MDELMTADRRKLAAIKACRLRGLDPHEEVVDNSQAAFQGRSPRWTIVAQELLVLEPLLRGIMFAYESLPPDGD